MSSPTLRPPGSDPDPVDPDPAAPEKSGAETFAVAVPPAGTTVGGGEVTSPTPGQRRSRRRWVIGVAAVLVVVLAVAGWVLWSNWIPSAPGAPHVGTLTLSSVELRWTAPQEGPGVDAYLVQRDGVQVASVTGPTTTYVDQALAPDSSHRYSVVAASGSKRSSPSPQTVVRTLPAPPTNVVATAKTTSAVTLQWSPPFAGRSPDGYVVFRDGKELATLGGATRSFHDTGLLPVTTYGYTVVTVKGALRSAPSAPLRVSTSAPPAADGRLSGPSLVEGKIVEASPDAMIGDTPARGQTFTSTWSFSPKTASTPAPVVVTGEFGGETFTLTLTPSGGTYRGTTVAHLTHCGPVGQVPVNDALSVTLTVKTAELVTDAWTATTWTGTMKVDSPYTPVGTDWYCPSGTMTATLTGSPTSGSTPDVTS